MLGPASQPKWLTSQPEPYPKPNFIKNLLVFFPPSFAIALLYILTPYHLLLLFVFLFLCFFFHSSPSAPTIYHYLFSSSKFYSLNDLKPILFCVLDVNLVYLIFVYCSTLTVHLLHAITKRKTLCTRPKYSSLFPTLNFFAR